jgi:hypothetical protein
MSLSDQFLKNPLAQEGLLKKGKKVPQTPSDAGKVTNLDNSVAWDENAEDYLYSIGASTRLAYLKIFKNLLKKLQDETPWFFQTVTGLSEIYKLEPGKNFRGKKDITFDCLESVDLRMSMLADLYRNTVYDFEYMREILPINMRTFGMKIHILEMRNFNTTFGILSAAYRNKAGIPNSGSSDQQIISSKLSENVYGNTTLFSEAANNVLRNVTPPGVNRGINGVDTTGKEDLTLSPAFDAISVVTFDLGMCEFDFFSEAPSYLDAVSVADIPMATNKFKVKCGTVKKVSQYSFYEYLINEFSKDSQLNLNASNGISPGNISSPVPGYDRDSTPNQWSKNNQFMSQNTIFPTSDLASEYAKIEKERAEGVKNYATNVFTQGVLGALESSISSLVNSAQSNVNSAVLGNVYQPNLNPYNALQALNGFLNPDLAINSGTSTEPPSQTITGGGFDPLVVPSDIVELTDTPITLSDSITGGGFDVLPTDTTLTDDDFVVLPVDTTITDTPFDELVVSDEIAAQTFDTLEVANTVEGGGFDTLGVVGEISASPLTGVVIDNEISPSPIEPLETNTEILPGAVDALEISTEISGFTLEGVPSDNSISNSPMETLPVSETITGGGLEPFTVTPSISDIDLEGVTPGNNLASDNVEFEKLETNAEIEPKSVNFNNPPQLPGIDPSNVYNENNQ